MAFLEKMLITIQQIKSQYIIASKMTGKMTLFINNS